MILGACNHSIHTVMEAIRRCGPHVTAHVLRGETLVDSTVHVLPQGVRQLRSLAAEVEGARTVLLVMDALDALRTIDQVVLIDARPADVGWTPRPIRMPVLRASLTSVVPHGPVTISPSPVVDNLVLDARSRGVFDKVLAYAQRLPGPPERDVLHRSVAAYLSGRLPLQTMRRRTRPKRDVLAPMHELMCDALTSPNGEALGRAVKMVVTGVDAAVASAETGADAFEVRYVTAVGLKVK